MGDRRQIEFKDMGMWYYTHWEGYSLLEDLQKAISYAEDRWCDNSYCFRIILTKLFEKNLNSTTGAGFYNENMDTQYKHNPIVFIKTQQVGYDGVTYSFEEFCELDLETLKNE